MSKNAPSNLVDLTESELKLFQVQKTRLFKGTIAVCGVYGGVALLLLLVAVFDTRGRAVLTDVLLPFVITFVSAMVLIIIFLVIQITSYKPTRLQQGVYDADVCPDYWTLEKTPPTDIPSTASDADKYLMRYRCVPDKKVYAPEYKVDTNSTNGFSKITTGSGITNIYNQKVDTNSTNPNQLRFWKHNDDIDGLGKAALAMYSTQNQLQCDKVYPALLASRDITLNKNTPNKLRCKYTEKCGISWSAVCPSQDS